MRALAVDVGTGTQDVLLLDADREVENALQLVLPSPTAIVAGRIRAATRAGQRVVLSGVTMGGGPSAWAARDHARAGLPILATPDAARTLDDDLPAVEALGVRVLSEDEAHAAARRPRTIHVECRDAWLPELERAVACFDVELRTVDALALAVFDHGAAPPGVSDRRFRFERLADRLAAEPDTGPVAFAYRDAAIPAAFTRLTAAALTARDWMGDDRPLVVMDTAPAAILGALEDAGVRGALAAGRPLVVVNVGNFHTLAFRLSVGRGPSGDPAAPSGGGSRAGARIDGLFEHHTGELDRMQLIRFLRALEAGMIEDRVVFDSMGHGALVRGTPAEPAWRAGRRPLLAVTGPRRDLLGPVPVPGLGRPHFAIPHGTMMQAGGFGLLRALAHRVPALREPIERRLGPPVDCALRGDGVAAARRAVPRAVPDRP